MSGEGFDYVALTSTAVVPTLRALLNASGGPAAFTPPRPPDPAAHAGVQHMRLLLTITHLLLVSLGTINLLVVFVIAVKPYMRSITNVYMVSLCLADFLYLANLVLVAATQLNNKSWPFGQFLCTLYHGTETTGKYASVMFVVLLAADRYCAMCRPSLCARYRNYKIALGLSGLAWTLAVAAAFPLFAIPEVVMLRFPGVESVHKLCIAKWPNSDYARWYITFSSVLIFAIPLGLIVFFYYHILNKLRAAVKSNKRMRRSSSSRAPYHRVTRLVLWVVIFHVMCWSPFWTFNLFSSILRLRISTQFDRIVVNVIHLFPYMNCALNPLVYAVNAENFRRAFRSLFCGAKSGTPALCGDDAAPAPGAGKAMPELGSTFPSASSALFPAAISFSDCSRLTPAAGLPSTASTTSTHHLHHHLHHLHHSHLHPPPHLTPPPQTNPVRSRCSATATNTTTITNALNPNSERLLSIHSNGGQASALAQRCAASSMLTGGVFLPHDEKTPLPAPPIKPAPREPEQPESDELPPELQNCDKQCSVVRFVNETTEDLVFPIAVRQHRRLSSINSARQQSDSCSTATTNTGRGLDNQLSLTPDIVRPSDLKLGSQSSCDEVFM